MACVNTSGAIARLTKEIAHIQKGEDLSLAISFRDQDITNVKALIVGPPETPYEYGFFEFELKFGPTYPIQSPAVRCVTTNHGRTRFNPNIYADGKVCLSILGTWRGEPGEEWSSAQGLESVLVSIQSLMSANPYENEPGFEDHDKTQPKPKAYIAKIRHETLRISVIERLENILEITSESGEPPRKKTRMLVSSPKDVSSNEFHTSPSDTPAPSTPATEVSNYDDDDTHEYDADATYIATSSRHWDPFADVMKRRFLWYYDTYMDTVDTHADEYKSGQKFTLAEFEGGNNIMQGAFFYKQLRARLQRIKQALFDEHPTWAKRGLKQVADGTQIASQLQFQFKHLRHQRNETQASGSRLEVALPDAKNLFVWNLTFFGAPMTNLDGGVFSLTMHIPTQFPEAQPRVVLHTPIYHYRVSKGTSILCYFPSKPDEISSHLEAIVSSLEDENPIYDPRANVHPGAFALRWGDDTAKKDYHRRLRRSVQASYE